MHFLSYPLEQGKFINRFLTTDTFTKPQQFKKAVLQGRVNEWLKYGFSIHENPCRKEFLDDRLAKTPSYLDLGNQLPGDLISVFDSEKPLEIYFPFGNVSVENSRFYYTPTFLRTYSYTYLYSPQAHEADFELCTCGGMTVWVNDALVCDFTPFTRNMRKTTTVHFSLAQGCNKIIVCLDDLAERDTDYYFRIAYLGTEPLEIRIPIAETVSPSQVYEGETIISKIRFAKDVYLNEPAYLELENRFDRPLDVHVSYLLSIVSGRIHKQESLVRHFVRTMQPGQQSITIFEANQVTPSFYFLKIAIAVDQIFISRKIGTQVFDRALMANEDLSLAQRKQKLLSYVCENGIPNVYRCAAEYTLGKENELTEQTILEELDGIEMRKDCSDFHFVVILCLYQKYCARMSQTLCARIREVAVNFRYWMDEPGDDVMWFFSENHALLFHICQYAAGTLFPDDLFTTSQKTGRQQAQYAQALLNEWFSDFFKEFITEWNSNAYIPVDTLGFGALYTFTDAQNPLHEYAKKALDDVFYNLSINAHAGAIVTSFGRSYEEQLKGNYVSGTTGLLYLAFNRGFVNCGSMSYITLCMDDYTPPPQYVKNIDLAPDEELIFENTQGFENHVNLYLYKNKDSLLSTAIQFKPFQPGYQEHIVQACIDPVTQAFVTHPGECQPYGSGRPNYWAGNGILPRAVQYRNTAVIVYDIPSSHLIDYTHAYFPSMHFDEFTTLETCVAGRKGDGYIGIISANRLSPVVAGPLCGREYRSLGRRNVWILSVASTAQYSSLSAFVATLQATTLSFAPSNEVTVRLADASEICVMADGTTTINGTPIYSYPLTPEGRITKHKGELR